MAAFNDLRQWRRRVGDLRRLFTRPDAVSSWRRIDSAVRKRVLDAHSDQY